MAWCQSLLTLSFTLFLLSKLQLGHSFAACKSVFYGVKFVHKLFDLPDPTNNSRAIAMLDTIRRLDDHAAAKKDPLSPAAFRKLYQELMVHSRSLEDIRTMLFVVFGFCGFLRFSEIIVLRKGDVVLEHQHIRVFVEKSKTDIYRDGRWVYIAQGLSHCPVKVVLTYLEKCASQLTADSFLFRGVVKSKRGQRLRVPNKHVCYSTMSKYLRKALLRINESHGNFGTHSLRSGGASAAANAGVPDRLFKRHGRWKSDRAKDGYVKDNVTRLLSVTRALGM